MRLFLYGTLRDIDLLEIVLGRVAHVQPAALPGHAVHWVAGESYPVIQTRSGAKAEGLLLEVTAQDRARLDFYEGGFGYALAPVTLEGGARAECYFITDTPQIGPGWSLTDWQARWGEITRNAARQAMAVYGKVDAGQLARRYPRLRARAWSDMLARNDRMPRDPARHRDSVQLTTRERRHWGFFALDVVTLDHPTFAGGRSGPLEREVFISSDAAIVLPYDPVRDRVLLVEQFRSGLFVRGAPDPWSLEPVAGLVDPGEDPAQTAHRETLEEAGIRLERLETVIAGYPSPGATSEFYHCYVGICDLPDDLVTASGVAQEGEDIRSHVIGFDEAMEWLLEGRIDALPAAMILWWLAAARPRLRAP